MIEPAIVGGGTSILATHWPATGIRSALILTSQVTSPAALSIGA